MHDKQLSTLLSAHRFHHHSTFDEDDADFVQAQFQRAMTFSRDLSQARLSPTGKVLAAEQMLLHCGLAVLRVAGWHVSPVDGIDAAVIDASALVLGLSNPETSACGQVLELRRRELTGSQPVTDAHAQHAASTALFALQATSTWLENHQRLL